MVLDAARLASSEAQGAAELVELFSSIQGEGPRLGERHLFVRFVHCDIHCAYCDTPLCHAPRESARIEEEAGRGRFGELPNPIPLSTVADLVAERLGAAPHAAVSLTGGEPLLQPWAIEALAPVIRGAGVRVLLETDGNLAAAFARVVDDVDVLSLDWKPPSATGEPPCYEEHREFLALARERDLECYVKVVFTGDTPLEEILVAARSVAELCPKAPFILQPCTPFARVREAPPPELSLAFQESVAGLLTDVRVIPQVHHTMGVM